MVVSILMSVGLIFVIGHRTYIYTYRTIPQLHKFLLKMQLMHYNVCSTRLVINMIDFSFHNAPYA